MGVKQRVGRFLWLCWWRMYLWLFRVKLTEHVTGTAGHNVPAEIEYRDSKGVVWGFWAYGYWHPDYPYKG